MVLLYKKERYIAIGLMSGTSCDGVDAAAVETDGQNYVKPLAYKSIAYPPSFQQQLVRCGKSHNVSDDIIRALMNYHLKAVQRLDIKADVIGLHGHTIAHDPANGTTTQIEDATWLAQQTGTPVVYDFRSNDVKNSGQGAPLVPVYHRVLAANLEKPVAFLNIGGVANLTYIDDNTLIAGDTGMGNGLVDEYMQREHGKPFDANGALAAKGTINKELINQWLEHPFFKQPPPKSIDRYDFPLSSYKADDLVTQLTAFTAESIKAFTKFLPKPPKQYIVCGGGRYNKTLLSMLQNSLQMPVCCIEDIGFNGDATEAEAFGYLAVRHLNQLPLTFPSTTGVDRAMTGGKLTD